MRRRFLTPVGLRSLAPGTPTYREKYYGDLRARDASYHQGTVWAWLIVRGSTRGSSCTRTLAPAVESFFDL